MTGRERPGEPGSRDRLERRYERLLRWYPAGHQARHGGEMLGVLLAAAGPGQERPGPGESANLIGGALRIRLRAAATGSAGHWRDALARAAILLPLAALVLQVTILILLLATARGTVDVPRLMATAAGGRLSMLVLLIIVLAGWRRIALAATAVLAALVIGTPIVLGQPVPYFAPGDASELTILLIVALAMVLTAGSPAGRTLLTWRHYTLTAVLVAASLIVPGLAVFLYPNAWGPTRAGGLIAVIVGLVLFAPPTSRRLLAIVALPLYFYFVAVVPDAFVAFFPAADLGMFPPYLDLHSVLLVDVPLAAVLLAAVVIMALAAARHRRSRRPADGSAA
jgi:hypothetical protein